MTDRAARIVATAVAALVVAWLSAELVGGQLGPGVAPVAVGLIAGGLAVAVALLSAPTRAILLALAGVLVGLSTGTRTAAAPVDLALSLATPPLAIAAAAAAVGLGTGLAIAAAAASVTAGPLAVLFIDPLTDPSCAGCGRSAVLVASLPRLAGMLEVVGGVGLALAVLAGAIAVRGGRRWALLAIAAIAWASLGARWSGVAWATGAVGVAILSLVVRLIQAARVAARLASLGQTLDHPSARATLRRTVRDTTVDLVYPGDVEGEWLDGGGGVTSDRPGVLVRSGDRVVAGVTATGEGLAKVGDAITPDVAAALDAVGHEVRLARRTQELATSRRRVVERGDLERLRLERDLHDGAQLHLLALGMTLRPAAAAGDPVAQEALAETGRALVTLRDISHGVYPALLVEQGPVAAIRALARRQGAQVTVGGGRPPRLPATIELSACLVAEAWLDGEDPQTCDVRSSEDAVELVFAPAPARPPTALVERMAALGGSLVADDDAEAGVSQWILVLPRA